MMQTACGKPAIINLVSRGLLAATALCVLVAGLLFFWVGDQPLRVPYLNVQLLPDEELATDVDFEASLQRPLFWETRRPVVESAIVEQVQEPEKEEVIEPLVGVRLLGILAKGDDFTALLEIEGKIERVQKGSSIKQWNVSDITGHEVHFSRQGKRSVLSLEREIHKSIKLEP